MRYFIELSYNGKAYHGWQNQPDAISVQEVLEDALSKLLGESIEIVGAGRTDAGVHALQMYAHFDYEGSMDSDDLIYKLNSFLSKDIAIYGITQVSSEAHARFDATSRSYVYRIAIEKNPFNFDSAYFLKTKLNLEAMQEATKILFEYEDFQCFSKSNTDVKTYLCDIMEAHWTVVDKEWHFYIKADRFLRNMVRAIVGTLLNVGLGKIPVASVHDIIRSKDRGQAGYSVPAHGLYLKEICYPQDIFNE
ncbi:tRNA pseudouridine(38-40) synthase TruA [Mangrovimonas futianensis]|uniref:tRNA pseudouridine(38-40) synthase TruA n=1 Tax=Mangrovimonas futianensis TaxID=2895523 RepID=UPI001E381B70|nr:tRNA pseudouridine(38-40) synthase TruA [Mangrovimonas futianensis]MCF1421097.1 tRNA pseudouridine(38-40) synthase TruA [Mangrovimonas futianensis]